MRNIGLSRLFGWARSFLKEVLTMETVKQLWSGVLPCFIPQDLVQGWLDDYASPNLRGARINFGDRSCSLQGTLESHGLAMDVWVRGEDQGFIRRARGLGELRVRLAVVEARASARAGFVGRTLSLVVVALLRAILGDRWPVACLEFLIAPMRGVSLDGDVLRIGLDELPALRERLERDNLASRLLRATEIDDVRFKPGGVRVGVRRGSIRAALKSAFAGGVLAGTSAG